MSFYRGTENRTEVSAKQWDYITQENLTAREAVAFLYSGMQTRTFRDVLRQVCPDAEQSDRLTEGLCAINPDAQPDSIRRKVQNWMGGKALPTQREDVFQICFALGLDLEQSDRMLGLLTGEALEGEQTYSMEYVAEEYLRLNVPKDKKTARYTDVQKLVKKYWPSPRSFVSSSLLRPPLITRWIWRRLCFVPYSRT